MVPVFDFKGLGPHLDINQFASSLVVTGVAFLMVTHTRAVRFATHATLIFIQ